MSDSISAQDFDYLLKLQEVDSSIDQLRHRVDAHKAHSNLDVVQKSAATLRPRLDEATTQRNSVAAQLQQVEDEVKTIDGRTAVINAKLYDGSSNISPGDALAMSHEVEQLALRKTKLEDAELAHMEALEPLDHQVEKLQTEAARLAVDMRRAQAELVEAEKELVAGVASTKDTRESLEAAINAKLLNEYTTLRRKIGGVVVAHLQGNTCGGCHLTLSSSEAEAIRAAAPDVVTHCEDCGRILVR